MKKYTTVLVISIATILFIYQSVSLYQIKKELENIRSDNTQMKQEILSLINGIDSNISATIYEEIGKSHLTKDVNFTFKSNIEGGHNVDVRVELAKYEDNSKVIFMYKNESENIWKETELKKSNELSYIGNIDLPYGNQYEYKVIVSGEHTESSEINYLDKSEFIPNKPDVSFGYSESEIYLTAYDGYYYDNNETKINSIDMIVGYDGKEKSYKCKYSPESEAEDGVVSMSRNYEATIPRKDFNNKFDYIKMKVTYKNGVIDVVDITSQLRELNAQIEGENNER